MSAEVYVWGMLVVAWVGLTLDDPWPHTLFLALVWPIWVPVVILRKVLQ